MTDISRLTLDDLWRDVPRAEQSFDRARISHLPSGVRRYLGHAMAPGTPLASAVRLEMNGHIKLNGKWLPFDAEQVIRWDRGLIWKARTKMGALTIRGSDRFIDGKGLMRWKLFGLIPVVTAEGADISRSAAGRLEAESMWLPSVLLGDEVEWKALDEDHLRASLSVPGDRAELGLVIDSEGRLVEQSMQRWGNPEGGEFHDLGFGALVLAESTFDGFTIPSELRVGWYFGTERWEAEGEFWRATITSATFR